VEESASHTGEVENILHPSALSESNPQTLHAPFERHLYVIWLAGQLPIVSPFPALVPSS